MKLRLCASSLVNSNRINAWLQIRFGVRRNRFRHFALRPGHLKKIPLGFTTIPWIFFFSKLLGFLTIYKLIGFLLGTIGTIGTFEDFRSVRAHAIPKLVGFAAPTHSTLEIIEVCSMSSNTSGGSEISNFNGGNSRPDRNSRSDHAYGHSAWQRWWPGVAFLWEGNKKHQS